MDLFPSIQSPGTIRSGDASTGFFQSLTTICIQAVKFDQNFVCKSEQNFNALITSPISR